MTRDAEATRARLVMAARKAFAAQGFERTTVREIAAAAGVNQALINRYFGGKEQLFAESVAIDLSFPDLSGVSRGEVGTRLVSFFFDRWEGRADDDLLQALVRTAATNAEAAERIRLLLAEQVGVMVAKVAGPERAPERAALIATQMLGLAYARYVLRLTDTDLPRATAIVMLGSTIERYLFEDLPSSL